MSTNLLNVNKMRTNGDTSLYAMASYGTNGVMEFATKFRGLYEPRISQEDLAPVLDVSQNTISGWATGKRLPDIREGKAIADYFGVDLRWLADDSMDEEPARPVPLTEGQELCLQAYGKAAAAGKSLEWLAMIVESVRSLPTINAKRDISVKVEPSKPEPAPAPTPPAREKKSG